MKRRVRIIAVLVTIVLLALAPVATVAAEQRQGTDVTVAAGETISGDLYATGQTITVDGKVLGDVVAAGTTIFINGTVAGDVLATGSEVWINGRVTGSVRALAGTVHVRGMVARDVLAGAGTVVVGAGSKVGGDVLGGIGDLTIGGAVRGVDVQVGKIHVTSSALVQGPLTYRSASALVVDQGAHVHGATTRQATGGSGPFTFIPGVGIGVIDWLRTLVGLVLLGSIGIALAPRFSRRTSEVLAHSPWASLGLGLAVVVCVPIAALVVFIAGIVVGGWWLALLLLALYAALFGLSVVVGGLTLGRLLCRWADWPRVPTIGALALGLALLGLVSLVPVAGALLVIVVSLGGTGALVLAAVQTRRTAPAVALAPEQESGDGYHLFEPITRDLSAPGEGIAQGAAR